MRGTDRKIGGVRPYGRVAAALAASICMAFAGDGFARTLKESVDITVKRHPEILRDKALAKAADKGIDQAFSGYLPTFDIDQEAGYEWTNSPTTRTRADKLPGNSSSVERLRRDSNASLRQMLFDGFGTQSRVSSAHFSFDTATYTVAETGERLGLRVAQLYLDVLRTQQFVDITQQNNAALTEIANQIRDLAQSGRGTGSDVDQADSRLAQGRAALEQRRGENTVAIARYIEVVGEMPADLVLPGAPQYQRPAGEEEAIAFAMQYHPSAQASAAFYLSRKADAKAAEAPLYYPRLDAEVLGSTGSNLDGNKGRDSDLNPRLRLRYTVFNGLGDLAHRDRADEEAAAAKQDDNEQRRRIREEVRVSFRNLMTAEERLPSLKAHASSAKQVLEGYRSQFELGKRSLLDLLDVQNELLQARLGLTDGEFRILLANFELVSSMGVLLDSFGIKIAQAKDKVN